VPLSILVYIFKICCFSIFINKYNKILNKYFIQLLVFGDWGLGIGDWGFGGGGQ
jgi:hypothetical protein